MKLLCPQLAVALLLITSFAHSATPYSIEFTAESGTSDVSGGISPSPDSDNVAFGLSYYLQATGDSAVPLAEAAYLAKSDSISVNYQTLESDDIDQSITSLSSRFVAPSNSIYKLGFNRLDADGFDSDSFTLGFGRHISDGHSYTFDLNYADEADIVSLLYLNRLVQDNGSGKWSTLEFNTGIIDIGGGNNLTIGISGDSYLSLNHGIGAGISYVDLDSGSLLALSLDTRYFISDRLFAELLVAYSKTDINNADVDVTNYTLKLGARF